MSHDRSHVPGGRSGGGRAHLTRQLLLELAAPGGGGQGLCPPASPLLVDLLKQGGGETAENSLLKVLRPHTIFISLYFFLGRRADPPFYRRAALLGG